MIIFLPSIFSSIFGFTWSLVLLQVASIFSKECIVYIWYLFKSSKYLSRIQACRAYIFLIGDSHNEKMKQSVSGTNSQAIPVTEFVRTFVRQPIAMSAQTIIGQVYFDVEGDDELRIGGSNDFHSLQRRITWRGDPEETGSDCTIVVITNELQAVTYHVHKSVICFGSKQSKYFSSQFLRSIESTSSSRKVPLVKVELDQRDAENIPILLDFMYKPCIQDQSGASLNDMVSAKLTSNGTMDTAMSSFSTPSLQQSSSSVENDLETNWTECEEISSENAVSLRYLARKFENEALTRVVNKFIQRDLNFSTGPMYLYLSWEYKDDRLMESAQRLCAENISQLDIKALIRLPLNLFRIVAKSLESFEQENKELSLLLSDVVCRYLEKNPTLSTAEILLELTDPLRMPYISSEAAIGFTAIVKDLEPDNATVHWDGLVRLCRRCARAVVKEYGWSDFSINAAVNEFLINHNEESNKTLLPHATVRVDGLLFATSFAAALEQAQDDYEDIAIAHKHFKIMMKSLQESVSILEKGLQRKDDFIAKQQTELRNARSEIRKLKQQIEETEQQLRLQRSSHIQSSQRQTKEEVSAMNGQSRLSAEMINTASISYIQSDLVDTNRRLQSQQSVGSSTSNHKQQNREARPSNSTSLHQPLHRMSSGSGQHYSSPAPMARQRLQQQERDKLNSVPNNCQRQQNDAASAPQPSQTTSIPQQPFDESAARFCIGKQPQPRRRQQHIPLSKANDAQYKYHPDLLEMSYSEQSTTFDHEDDDDENELMELEMSFSTIEQDLISPSQVGVNVHNNKNRKRRELKTKSEMRSKSLLV
jgi:BTB/POZ domain